MYLLLLFALLPFAHLTKQIIQKNLIILLCYIQKLAISYITALFLYLDLMLVPRKPTDNHWFSCLTLGEPRKHPPATRPANHLTLSSDCDQQYSGLKNVQRRVICTAFNII